MTNERVVIRAKELSKEDLYFLEQDKKNFTIRELKRAKKATKPTESPIKTTVFVAARRA